MTRLQLAGPSWCLSTSFHAVPLALFFEALFECDFDTHRLPHQTAVHLQLLTRINLHRIQLVSFDVVLDDLVFSFTPFAVNELWVVEAASGTTAARPSGLILSARCHPTDGLLKGCFVAVCLGFRPESVLWTNHANPSSELVFQASSKTHFSSDVREGSVVLHSVFFFFKNAFTRAAPFACLVRACRTM